MKGVTTKTLIRSMRLYPMEESQVRRIYKAKLSEFFRAALKVSLENNYIRNKILEALNKGGK